MGGKEVRSWANQRCCTSVDDEIKTHKPARRLPQWGCPCPMQVRILLKRVVNDQAFPLN